MENEITTDSAAARFAQIDSLLRERGHDVGSGRVRVAAGPSGIAVGFPEKPMIHVSWWALGGVAALVAVLRRRRHG